MKAGALNDGGAGLVYRGSLVFRRDSLGTPSAGEAPCRYHYTGQEDQGPVSITVAPNASAATVPYTDFGARHYSPALRRWLVPDPLSEDYYGISPYAYCAGDPINLVDVDGMDFDDTDYFNLKGEMVLHIEDGLSDKFILLQTGGVQASINSGAVIPVPPQSVIDSMDAAYDRTEKTGKEVGFQVDVNGTPGPFGEGSENDLSFIPYVYHTTGAYVAYDVHTHPKPEYKEGMIFWNNLPSQTDIDHHEGGYPNIVLGYNESSVKSMAFYDKSGQIGKAISFNRFKKTVIRIYKKQ